MRIKPNFFKRCIFFLITILILAACAGKPNDSNPSGNQLDTGLISTVFPSTKEDQNTGNHENSPPENSQNNRDQHSISAQLQGLNFDSNQFRVISSEQVDWADSCLGIEQPGADCDQKVTPGYLIVLEANGLEFKYHADQNGSQVQPATPALLWTRDGGEQEYCDKLIIYLPDTVHICWCQDGEFKSDSAILQDVLSIEEYDQFINALQQLSTTTINLPSSGESEPAMVSLTFYGQGKNFPDTQEQQTLLTFAQTIYSRLSQ